MKSYLTYLVIILNLLSTTQADEWKFSYRSAKYFTAIWGSAANDVFAVGAGGLISHYDGSQWQEMESGTLAYLMEIWGTSSTNVFALGTDGTILHYDGNQWRIMTSGIFNTSLNGMSIWGGFGTEVFAVGNRGVILHYDGNQWSTMSSGTNADLYGIWGSSNTDVFAVGTEDTILHYDGNQWTTMTSRTAADSISGIWGSSSTDVFAVGTAIISDGYEGIHAIPSPHEGRILHYDGNQWRTMTSVTLTDFSGIWGTSNTNVFAVSTGTVTSTAGTIFHYNGNYLTTTTITSSDISSIYDIWGSPEGDVFAASDQGILRCANCQQPVQEYLPATFFLANLTASTPENQPVIQWSTANRVFNIVR